MHSRPTSERCAAFHRGVRIAEADFKFEFPAPNLAVNAMADRLCAGDSGGTRHEI